MVESRSVIPRQTRNMPSGLNSCRSNVCQCQQSSLVVTGSVKAVKVKSFVSFRSVSQFTKREIRDRVESICVSISKYKLENVNYRTNLKAKMDENEFFKQTVQHLAQCLSNLNPTPWEKVRQITTLYNSYFVMFSFNDINVYVYFYFPL